MQFPSSKVVFATLAALVSAAAVVLGSNGIPTDVVGWLKTIGAILGVAAAAGGAGYAKTETNPPRGLVEAIRARQVR